MFPWGSAQATNLLHNYCKDNLPCYLKARETESTSNKRGIS
jgi:hypothetical protein